LVTIGSEAWRWRGHVVRIKRDGPCVLPDVYSFMTTTPNELVGTINHERMPVLLSTDQEFETWIRGTADEAFSLLKECPPDKMRMVQSGFEKRDLLQA
jgi:putative SOS response-associated peptidase YedK